MKVKKSEFQLLAAFLERCEAEVQGRGRSDGLTEETRIKLERLTKGECSPQERQELCEALRENPDWISWVVDRIKHKRVTARRSKKR